MVDPTARNYGPIYRNNGSRHSVAAKVNTLIFHFQRQVSVQCVFSAGASHPTRLRLILAQVGTRNTVSDEQRIVDASVSKATSPVDQKAIKCEAETTAYRTKEVKSLFAVEGD
jgi:hypothetical protein